MKASIIGIGQWVPERVRENSEWPQEFIRMSAERRGDRTLVDIPRGYDDPCHLIAARYLEREALDPFLGTTRRRVADADTSASEAETLAARAALREARVDPRDIDVILSWAIVPDRIAPSNACRVGHSLGATRAWSMSVDAACSSIVTQLTVAAALIEAGRARVVLLTESHLVTRAMPWTHPASPNVGDGAGAIVVAATEQAGILATHAVTQGEYYDAVLWCRGKTPESDPPWWLPGGRLCLGSHDPSGAQVLMQNTVRVGVQTVQELLEGAATPLASIDVLACVQPRRWVPSAIAEGLGLDPACAPQTFDEYAHLGAVGVIANLLAARDAGRLRRGATVALYAQGAGFTRSAALLRW